MNPSRLSSSCLHVGFGIISTAFTLSGSGLIPSLERTWPMNFTSVFRRFIFLLLSFRLTSRARLRRLSRFSSWFFTASSCVSPYPTTNMSSRSISTPLRSSNFSCNLHSNSSGAALIPKGIRRYRYLPKGVQKVVNLLLSSSSAI